MAILYALVARGSTVLAEFTEQRGNFQKISQQILEKIPSSRDTKVSYAYDNYVFHIAVSDGITYFCMSEKEFGNRVPFAFLDDIKQRFEAQYGPGGERASTAGERTLNRDFGRVLRTQMTYFSNPAESDKFERVRGQISDVKNLMIDNIEKVLDRGEKIDLLVDRTEDLTESAQDFRYKSRKLKNKMLWKNIQLVAILILIILAVLFIIVWIACGIFPPFGNCIKLFQSE